MDRYEKTPATFGLVASWIILFLAMIAVQGGLEMSGNIITSGILPWTGHSFGDLTSRALLNGQVWKALTATFVHYSVPHIFFNLLGLWQLGRLMESWYGTSQFLGLYVVIGFFGNLLAGLSKPLLAVLLQSWVTIPVLGASGGGSGVLCGFIAMLAVVGWREKTRYGDYLKTQMLVILVVTAILGVIIPNIDNFGHAGGAILGACCGFLDPILLRRVEQPRKNRWIAVVSIAAILLSFGLQGVEAKREHTFIQVVENDLKARREALTRLSQLAMIYSALSQRGPHDIAIDNSQFHPGRRLASRDDLSRAAESMLKVFAALPKGMGDESTAKSLATVSKLTRTAETRRPTPGEIALFDREVLRVARRLQQEERGLAAFLARINPRPAKPVRKPRLGEAKAQGKGKR